ncbi:uncharacterized protein C8Q71DRAFT_859904 [Rhodofomes roseus]|uniref:DUF6532 domain-containing protein n=1 Tax=Rhodofomes roseus TaxID=34475 RepID=A0ABQ8KBK7_9APHY|nr:uncharacterized protein C8Q71DRAFT_859904 [Rhodofomes roseus]KAH9834246.1 hypothetical protein C8Q71DRAFT_859904 [Rhodofomes roseus]
MASFLHLDKGKKPQNGLCNLGKAWQDRLVFPDVIAEVIAGMWYTGKNPDAFRPGCREKYDLDGQCKIIPSNMIALACCAILAAFDDVLDATSVHFQQKVYAAVFDKLKIGVDVIQRDENLVELANSMNKTLKDHIKVYANLKRDDGKNVKAKKAVAEDPGFNTGMLKAKWRRRAASNATPAASQRAAEAGPSNAGSGDKD